MVSCRLCNVRIRASEVVRSSMHQIWMLLMQKLASWRIGNLSVFGKSDSCEHVLPTGAALPGAHILTDVHPTNAEISNAMACKDS